MLKGAITALVTPFKDGKVNYQKLSELIEYQIENSIDGIVVCGTTGESATLDNKEKKKVIKYVVNKVKGRVPVIAGTGSNDTAHSIELSMYADSVGADYILLVTPYYNKATQPGLIKHFTKIADSMNIPCILYNVPSRTGVNIEAKTVAYLSNHPNIVGIKEASGNMSQILEIMAHVSHDFLIFSGNDDMIVPMLSLGAHGVISVISNILPKETHDMCQYYFNGNVELAKKLQLEYADVIKSIFIEVNPIPIKEALNILGFDVGDPRLPLTKMSETNSSILEASLKSIPKYVTDFPQSIIV